MPERTKAPPSYSTKACKPAAMCLCETQNGHKTAAAVGPMAMAHQNTPKTCPVVVLDKYHYNLD